MMRDIDRHPEDSRWIDRKAIVLTRLNSATDEMLAEELRNPTSDSVTTRDLTVREALARILERKP